MASCPAAAIGEIRQCLQDIVGQVSHITTYINNGNDYLAYWDFINKRFVI